jgi:hypothetical protein
MGAGLNWLRIMSSGLGLSISGIEPMSSATTVSGSHEMGIFKHEYPISSSLFFAWKESLSRR